MWTLLVQLVCLLAVPANALHESDVGVIDWHKQLVGVPLIGTAVTAPAFHAIPGHDTNVILTATENNVLAALNSTDGAVVWRFVYDPEDGIAGFHKHGNVVASLSGPGGSTLRVFDVLTGHITLEKLLHDPASGHVSQPHQLGKHVAFDTESTSLYTLTNGHTLTKIDGATKEVSWTWSSPDQTALTIYSHTVPTPTATYLIGISKSYAGYTLHITALDPSTGELLLERAIPSAIKDLDSYLLLSSPSVTGTSHVLWLEDGLLKSLPLVPDLKATASWLQKSGKKRTKFSRFEDLGLSGNGYVVAVEEDGTEHLVGIDPVGVKEFWELKSGDARERSEALWAGGMDAEKGDMFVSKVYWLHATQRMKVETFKVGAATSLVNELSMSFPFNTVQHGVINYVRLLPNATTNTASFLLTTSTGAVQVWHIGTSTDSTPQKQAAPKEKWTREESLATATVAEFVELPEAQAVYEEGKGLGSQETFVGRVSRQVRDAKNFPQYAVNFVTRFVSGTPTPASASARSLDGAPLTRDTFGFRQVLVVATAHGKLFGLDTSTGDVLWSRILGLGWAAKIGGTVTPVKIFGGFGEGGKEVVVVAQRRASNTLVDSIIFHIDALTGADARAVGDQARAVTEGSIEGLDIVSGPLVEAFLLDPPTDASLATQSKATSKGKKFKNAVAPTAKTVLLLDEFLQVHPYPEMPESQATLDFYADSLYLPLRANADDGKVVPGAPSNGQNRLLGHKVQLKDPLSDQYVAYPVWTFSLSEGDDIHGIVPAFRSSGASKSGATSWGKVVGNRTTLYKYLNPRMMVVLTTPRSSSPGTRRLKEKKGGETCGIYILDSAKGSVLYRAAVPAVEGTCDVKASLVENWLVYHYYDGEIGRVPGGNGEAKGWRVVTVELYEGNGVDQRTKSSELSVYSDDNTKVLAFEQSYVFPHAITAIAPTTTKFGITNKDLIVANRNHQIQSIQRLLLNPRRPNRKTTAEEQEEYLIPYEPIIAYDPHRVLSHNYEVANIHKIITTPALLESTSLVFAFGLDMFLTRVAPSGTFDVLSESFNKAQLVLTVLGLLVAIVVTRPMVKKKQLREKWYQ